MSPAGHRGAARRLPSIPRRTRGLVLLAALAGCRTAAPRAAAEAEPRPPCLTAGQVPPTVAAPGPGFRPVPVVQLLRDDYAPGVPAAWCVLRSDDEVAAAWSRFGLSPAPTPEPGTMVLLVAMGVRTSTGYSVSIDSVHERGDTAVAFVASASPGRGCPAGDAMTAPVHAVRVPARAVVLVHRVRTAGPPPCS